MLQGGRHHGQDHRHRPRHDQQLRRDHGRRAAEGDRELGRRAHDAFGRRVPGRRRDPRRRAGQAAGGHQRQEHDLRGQAADRPALRGEGSPEGHRPHALQDRQARQRRRVGRGPRQEDRAAAGVGGDPAQDEEDRRGLSRRGSDRGRHHRPGVLQRLAAAGDEGRRPDRRSRGQADHQRADGGRARVRHGQEGRRATARSPSTTWAAARSTSRSSRSPTSRASTSSRCCRPTATRSSAARTSTSG